MTSALLGTSPNASPDPPPAPLLDVRGLSVDFRTPEGAAVHAVREVDFTLRRGETLAVVGESGSGKSTTALALMRMLPGSGRITAGSVRLGETELTAASEEELRTVRGARIGMIFQDPMTSLNPVLSIRTHLDEVLRAHGRGDRAARRERAAELLDLVGIPDPRRRLDDHPHQFSGGQRQRILIAMALANEPDVLLADEPTTALDTTVQEQILQLLAKLNEETGTALVLITHNMGVVARSCSRVLVMYGGTVVEDGPTAEVLTRPRHPYTAGLLAAVPRLSSPSGTRLTGIPGSPPDLSLPLAGCAFAARCALADERCGSEAPPLEPASAASEDASWGAEGEDGRRVACWHADGPAAMIAAPPPVRAEPYDPAVLARAEAELEVRLEAEGEPGDRLPADDAPLLEASALRKEFRGRGRAGRRHPLLAVDEVSLRLEAGETLGVVGESGSGKSTLARLLAHAHPADGGTLRLRGEDVTRPSRTALRRLRRQVQMVFQDPYASLNPRMTVGDIVGEPLLVHGLHPDRAARERRVAELLELVGLDPASTGRHPRDFSGGQRQRIGIARALAPEPSVLICDEPVSALDVSVQAQIVNLLSDLQRDLGLALLFIAHDLAVVRQVSHRIAVMHRGRIIETGPADELCESPQHPYTQALLAAAPEPVPAAALGAPAA
ncbi:ABC transporter ATP-binding protein [Streptomyces sp. HC44]|uniref:ABC transporter ATP-binding protein n=1 Tax=Streptomyces scabichelini TaxID=2711217 RepID=A0A6G4VC10_9ACTN|nr:ABC transporter ATP-binding protein [Streptomyces scabichelini]NGO11662.1 ABC transporter ATP-binding protein [Streptomyces scabichelini]